MKKLYLISNYVSVSYELNEYNVCKIIENLTKIERNEGKEPKISFLSINDAMDKFKENISVNSYGILRALVMQRIDLEEDKFKWQILSELV